MRSISSMLIYQRTTYLTTTNLASKADTPWRPPCLPLLKLFGWHEWTPNHHQILQSIRSDLGITGTVHWWLQSYLRSRSFRVSWKGLLSWVTSTNHWGASRFSACSSSFLHLHNLTRHSHTGTWLLLPLICRWYAALSFISTWWFHCLTSYTLLPYQTYLLESKSFAAQPGKDRAPCWCKPIGW